MIHGTGFVYNDLKLDNILLDYGVTTDESGLNLSLSESALFDRLRLNVIDFGFASLYIDRSTKDHIKKTTKETFRGNIHFASLN